jgi:hypothetical protein
MTGEDPVSSLPSETGQLSLSKWHHCSGRTDSLLRRRVL